MGIDWPACSSVGFPHETSSSSSAKKKPPHKGFAEPFASQPRPPTLWPPHKGDESFRRLVAFLFAGHFARQDHREKETKVERAYRMRHRASIPRTTDCERGNPVGGAINYPAWSTPRGWRSASTQPRCADQVSASCRDGRSPRSSPTRGVRRRSSSRSCPRPAVAAPHARGL